MKGGTEGVEVEVVELVELVEMTVMEEMTRVDEALHRSRRVVSSPPRS